MKNLKQIIALALTTAALAISAHAVDLVNVSGASNIAVGGYDTVAFFTVKRALQGKREFSVEWMGEKWLFASAENLALFKANPEKYAPQYGGHCAWCVSENCICGRPARIAITAQINSHYSKVLYKGRRYFVPSNVR